ncbi:hypothetical protein FAZ19_13095 [Sphingobacterium alkalisoli]|uniref:Uncharacterized protein n=1 Tax=Sphingobacterium alkalisoli TaxID=1874115 RepID=A0A4U0H4A9_9SPHI|nr:hypothetical protein [Sphingobacterium alkalisoli]TJY66024.1 hypothetical protein FAZ19_13095 [Sphingobacterium alkalisoli]
MASREVVQNSKCFGQVASPDLIEKAVLLRVCILFSYPKMGTKKWLVEILAKVSPALAKISPGLDIYA